MPASKDPKKHAAQLRNLRSTAARKHGLYSEAELTPLRDRFIAELTEQFGGVATSDEIRLAATRRAKLEVVNAWLDKRGLLADKRSGRPRQVVALVDRIQAAYERQLQSLRLRAGQAGGGPGGSEPRFRIDLLDDERIGLLATDPEVRAAATRRVLTRLHEEGLREAEAGEPEGEKLDLRAFTDEQLDELEEIIDAHDTPEAGELAARERTGPSRPKKPR